MHSSPRDPTAPRHSTCVPIVLTASAPLQVQPPPASPATGKLLPDAHPTCPGPAPSPWIGAFSLSFLPGVLCSGQALCILTNKAVSPCHTVAASPSHTMSVSLFHAVPTSPLQAMTASPSHAGDAWKGFTQAAASAHSVIPPRVPSLCPAWGCPVGPWPQLSLHTGSSTLALPLRAQLSRCSCVHVPSEQRCSLLPALQWPGDKQAAMRAHTRASPKLLLTSTLPAWLWHLAHSRSLKELSAVQLTCPGPMPAPSMLLPTCSKLSSCSCPAFPW